MLIVTAFIDFSQCSLQAACQLFDIAYSTCMAISNVKLVVMIYTWGDGLPHVTTAAVSAP